MRAAHSGWWGAHVVGGRRLTPPTRDGAVARRCFMKRHGVPSARPYETHGSGPRRNEIGASRASYRGGTTNVTRSAREWPLASGLTPSSSAGACMRLTQNVG